MRIAVACQGLDVAPRFARSSSFMCYRVDRGMFADCQNMPNLSFPPAQLAQVLKDLDVSVMIVDRIDRILSNIDDENVIAEVKKEVNTMMNPRPMFAW